jgi:hypothetical protein
MKFNSTPQKEFNPYKTFSIYCFLCLFFLEYVFSVE